MNNTGVKTVALSMLLLLLQPVVSMAQAGFEDKYNISVSNMDNGLPSNFVDDLFVDSAGFLWIATGGGGLCRFDGTEQLTFSYATTPSVRSNFVRNVVQDGFNRLWVSSEGGLDILDLQHLTRVELELPIPEQAEHVCCSFVTIDATGALWAKFSDKLYRLSFDGEGSVAQVHVFTHPSLAPVNYVFKDVDIDGTVWAALDGRIHKIGLSGDALVASPLSTSLDVGEGVYVSDFLADGSQVWISTELGLYRLHRVSGEWKRYMHSPSDPRSLTQNFVTALARMPDGQVLASTLHGLNVYNQLTDNFTHLGEDAINGLRALPNGLLVATENNGWKVISPQQLSFTNLGRDAGLPAGVVNALLQEPSGRLWVGLVEGGLSVQEPGQKHFATLTREHGGLTHNSVSALCMGPDNTLYAGTWGGGIDVVRGSKPYKVLSHLPANGSLTNFVGLLEYDSRNNLLWVGSNQGIFQYDFQTRTYTQATREAVSGCIGSCIDQKGNLWVGCQQGLYVFNLNEKKADGTFPYRHFSTKLDAPEIHVEDKICSITEAPDGTIWLGSNGGGVYKAVETEDGWRFQGYSSVQGLSNDQVRGLAVDPQGNVWVSTVRGLNRLSPTNGSIVPFFREDGLPGDAFHWNNAFQGHDGLLYFGYTDGIIALDPSHFHEQMNVDPLRLTLVSVEDTEYRDPFLKELRLHEKDHSIRFCFSVLGFSGNRTHFQYKLEGFDKTWITLPEERGDVTYSTLPGGRYTLRVRAMDPYGNVTGSILLPVAVTPYFYRTWWFFLLVLVALVLTGWAVVLLRTRSLRRRQQELEQTVAQRTREISAQTRLVEQKAEELRRQNEVLLRQNEELASRKMLFSPERPASPEDNPFREKALEVVRGLYKNPDLDVNAFCLAMGVSKTLLNNKLQEAFGQSIGHFIRTYRLAVAKEMLESGTDATVAEVAYEVGFNDPKYFTRCFTKEFGMAPSAVGEKA